MPPPRVVAKSPFSTSLSAALGVPLMVATTRIAPVTFCPPPLRRQARKPKPVPPSVRLPATRSTITAAGNSTATATRAVSLLTVPAVNIVSVTVSRKCSVASVDGAVKVGLAAVALLSIT